MPAQYVVPQFIEVEDKVLGPISVRQFIELLVMMMIEFLFYQFLTFTTFLILGIPVFIFTAILAFANIRGQMFHVFMLNVILSHKRPRLRVWGKDHPESELREYIKKEPPPPPPPVLTKERPSSSRLSELSLVVNTGGVYKGDEWA